MTSAIQYQLSSPFFISSRLMPALRIGEATIHMQAVEVDHSEPDDPRVVWEYVIDAPSFAHAGRDLTTPYHGHDHIPAQLPTAMGALLDHLDHAASGFNHDGGEQLLPDPLYRWARDNTDDIAAMANQLEHRARSDPHADADGAARKAWRNVTSNGPRTAFDRWCIGQAVAHADRMATLNPSPDAAAGLAVRDELWHAHALRERSRLRAIPPPADPDSPRCLVADADRIQAWLDRPGPDPSTTSMAQYLGVGDTGPQWHLVPDLVEQAQLGGVFGVPGHHLQAHNVLDGHRSGVIAHLLTITTPDGAHLATAPIPASVHGPGREGVVDILATYANHVHDALAAHTGTATGPAGRRPYPFPRIDATPALPSEHPGMPTSQPAAPGHTR